MEQKLVAPYNTACSGKETMLMKKVQRQPKRKLVVTGKFFNADSRKHYYSYFLHLKASYTGFTQVQNSMCDGIKTYAILLLQKNNKAQSKEKKNNYFSSTKSILSIILLKQIYLHKLPK